MSKYIKLFDTTSLYNTYAADAVNLIYPTVAAAKDDLSTPYYHAHNSHNGHEYIEIGGVKWATTNIGASDVTEAGLYFQWGDTQGYTADLVGSGTGKKYFGWADYIYGDGTSDPGNADMSKYNSTDGKTVLDLTDDAARVNWGGNWRMPTTTEFLALGEAVNFTWTTNYLGSGINGFVCVDKIDSSKVLFLPATGFLRNGIKLGASNTGGYWYSSLYSSSILIASELGFDGNNINLGSCNNRSDGFQIRPVFTD